MKSFRKFVAAVSLSLLANAIVIADDTSKRGDDPSSTASNDANGTVVPANSDHSASATPNQPSGSFLYMPPAPSLVTPGLEFMDLLKNQSPAAAFGIGDAVAAGAVVKANPNNIIFVSGLTISKLMGLPDFSHYQALDSEKVTEFLARAFPGRIIITDVDSGFGNPYTAEENAEKLVVRGAAAVLLDNQNDMHRKAALAGGKVTISDDEYIAQLKPYVEAKLAVIARFANDSLNDAIRLADRSLENGAHALLLETAMNDPKALRELAKRYPGVPIAIIQIDKGERSLWSHDKVLEAGVNLVFYPNYQGKAAEEASMKAMTKFDQLVGRNATSVSNGGGADCDYKALAAAAK